jgi:hypothetical protein
VRRQNTSEACWDREAARKGVLRRGVREGEGREGDYICSWVGRARTLAPLGTVGVMYRHSLASVHGRLVAEVSRAGRGTHQWVLRCSSSQQLRILDARAGRLEYLLEWTADGERATVDGAGPLGRRER